ncbi:MAG: CoA transferase [SAR202 cluster bacterium]|jgi:crotonobetainyl-CoA:carnitine CoA-transferase CaiB-like acyl-CoA transferase|nr:carnitine dehydratase [Chloroflexota bacterium]MDP6663501.1 CoA transferase [SAR202 cluster bacterium]HAL48140.1 carnitine dehydratase [Dehalococcoidia bacterium]MDP6801361.1 CoA transferase [SAR202 cluster bacterium]MQG59586.1 CoA transferase [SAR202 cluster bacterium]|tara:strand:+ start:146 stop:1390 length:1245 start_codon:yes stop_codon:yes gene_type:complete
MNDQTQYGSEGPLKGIKVLDWTMWQFGPVSASMLGDMGADVIKIESLDGDIGRALARMAGRYTGLAGDRNAYFETCNRNKRGIAVDLKTEEGRQIVYRLVEQADVFIENFRQGVPERLGMDYETLKKINPKLIYGSASGYGPKGPDSDKPSLDGCGQARAGLMMSATPPGATEPNRVIGAASDQMGGITLCLGVVSALLARDRQGVGQRVDVSHLSSTMWLQGLAVGMNLLAGNPFGHIDRQNPVNPMVNLYECEDGRWIQFMSSQFTRYWPQFVETMGLQELLDDPSTANPQGMRAGSPELTAKIAARFKQKTADEWIEVLDTSADLIYAKVQSIDELQDDPQVIANNYITDFDHPVLGKIQVCNFPVAFSETPAGIWKEAPELGQDTETVLIDELGYDWDDIQRLQEANAIL